MQEFSAVSRCMAWLGFLTMNHRFVRRCFLGAIGEMKFGAGTQASTAGQALDSQPAADLSRATAATEAKSAMQIWFEDVDWHRMIGKRVTSIKGGLMSDSGQLHSIFVTFLSVSIETITEFYTDKSRDKLYEASEAKHAPLFDLTSTARSPFTSALQWLSSILEPNSPIINFVVPFSNNTTLQ